MARCWPAPFDAEGVKCLLEMASSETAAAADKEGAAAAPPPALGLAALVGEEMPFLFRDAFSDLLRLVQARCARASRSCLLPRWRGGCCTNLGL